MHERVLAQHVSPRRYRLPALEPPRTRRQHHAGRLAERRLGKAKLRQLRRLLEELNAAI
jgi:hypothetical protein